MVIVVRSDLALTQGKLASQVAHAAVTAALDSRGTAAFESWTSSGQTKVVAKVPSLEELNEVVANAEEAGIPVHVIADAGRTQVDPGTVTCCALGPALEDRLDAVTGRLPLL